MDEKRIWDYLHNKTSSLCAAAGIMDNLCAESSLRTDSALRINVNLRQCKTLDIQNVSEKVFPSPCLYQYFHEMRDGYEQVRPRNDRVSDFPDWKEPE